MHCQPGPPSEAINIYLVLSKPVIGHHMSNNPQAPLLIQPPRPPGSTLAEGGTRWGHSSFVAFPLGRRNPRQPAPLRPERSFSRGPRGGGITDSRRNISPKPPPPSLRHGRQAWSGARGVQGAVKESTSVINYVLFLKRGAIHAQPQQQQNRREV